MKVASCCVCKWRVPNYTCKWGILKLSQTRLCGSKKYMPKEGLGLCGNPMTQPTPKRTLALYGIAAWMTINILLMATLTISGDAADLNNTIEIALWAISVGALLSMRKWGAAFAIFTLIYTLSTSMGIIIYYQIWLNAPRVIINAAAIIYLFRAVFKAKFK